MNWRRPNAAFQPLSLTTPVSITPPPHPLANLSIYLQLSLPVNQRLLIHYRHILTQLFLLYFIILMEIVNFYSFPFSIVLFFVLIIIIIIIITQSEYKTRHNWVGKVIYRELYQKFKFNHTNKWYMNNPRIRPSKWNAQNSLGFWDTNGSSNYGQTTRPCDTIYQPLRSGRIWHKVNF